jgi:hypothetical protein
VNVAFMIAGGYWDIAPVVVPAAIAHSALVVYIQRRGKGVAKSILKA